MTGESHDTVKYVTRLEKNLGRVPTSSTAGSPINVIFCSVKTISLHHLLYIITRKRLVAAEKVHVSEQKRYGVTLLVRKRTTFARRREPILKINFVFTGH